MNKLIIFIICLVTALSPTGVRGEGLSLTTPIPCISRSHADSLARRLVWWQGRVCPLNTLATDVTLQLTGSRRPYRYTPEQVVASWALYPDVWNHAPLLQVPHRELRRQLGLEGKRIAVAQLYDGSSYRLQTLYNAQEDTTSALCRAIRELDSRVRLVSQIIDGTLIQPAPADSPVPSPLRISAELLWNKAPFGDILFAIALLAMTLGFVYYIKKPHAN